MYDLFMINSNMNQCKKNWW